jgi:hypothetical protein
LTSGNDPSCSPVHRVLGLKKEMHFLTHELIRASQLGKMPGFRFGMDTLEVVVQMSSGTAIGEDTGAQSTVCTRSVIDGLKHEEFPHVGMRALGSSVC